MTKEEWQRKIIALYHIMPPEFLQNAFWLIRKEELEEIEALLLVESIPESGIIESGITIMGHPVIIADIDMRFVTSFGR